ncbi:16S rRNA (guanine(966)-N(2))-methyltransferase RsmD [Candidatus Dojkabacteria bacterium]|nr:16S rRNA (guanine(966)-N(2))-methyltransferase RsmD [Candidatus Dojkabacteria bacterium]
MIRITAGKLKNRKLEVPNAARPLTDRIRLSVFDLLSDFTEDAKVLDLYAGSGVTGLEAISRGANSCTFIDKDEKAVKIIKANLKHCNLNDKSRFSVLKSSARRYLQNTKEKFDLIFLDPPFNQINRVDLDLISNTLTSNGIITARLPSNFTTERKKDIKMDTIEEVYKKKYGSSEVAFYRPKSATQTK